MVKNYLKYMAIIDSIYFIINVLMLFVADCRCLFAEYEAESEER